MIFWSSLGNFSTGFQLFSAVIGIVLDVLKINFMLDISDIYSSLLNLPLSQSDIRIIDGHWEMANDKSIEKVNRTQQNNKLKDAVEKALEKGDIACDRDKILDYLKTVYNVSVEPHIVEGWMKELVELNIQSSKLNNDNSFGATWATWATQLSNDMQRRARAAAIFR
jgi:hypothetical protein